LCPIVNVMTDPTGQEIAVLDLYKGAQVIHFQIPTADVPNMTGIQELGAKSTYLRRYLYNHVLDLDVPDEFNPTIDDNTGKTPVEVKKATAKQVEMIKGLYDAENIAKMLEYYGISSLEEMTLKDASAVIKRKSNAK
ncbi:MAG: hypothetical protein IKE23_05150, partial [Exiguobacterium sp.]|nr:hypothetical protein [Exiguobacterium sp.]